jgi:hypothetical protein
VEGLDVVEGRPGQPTARKRTPAEQQRLSALKRQIQAGRYETEEKLDLAVRRMLADLRGVATRRGASHEDESDGGLP